MLKSNMTNKYDDIIHLTRPVSKKHPPMPMEDRAAQFASFAALTGHSEAIKETARLTDEMIELDEDAVARINEQLKLIQSNLGSDMEVSITYFVPDERKEGGSYVNIEGIVKKIDSYQKILKMQDGTTVNIEQIRDVSTH